MSRSVLDSAIFASDSTDKILEGLEGEDRTRVDVLLGKIREAGREGDIVAIRLAKDTLGTSMKVLYGDKWPNWAYMLWRATSSLEDRLEGSGVSEIRRTVAGALPQAATWEPGNNFRTGARVVGGENGPQAAELQDERLIGATVALPNDLIPYARR